MRPALAQSGSPARVGVLVLGSSEQRDDVDRQLSHLPVAEQAVLALEPQIIAWAEEFARKENTLFLGRGMHCSCWPITPPARAARTWTSPGTWP